MMWMRTTVVSWALLALVSAQAEGPMRLRRAEVLEGGWKNVDAPKDDNADVDLFDSFLQQSHEGSLATAAPTRSTITAVPSELFPTLLPAIPSAIPPTPGPIETPVAVPTAPVAVPTTTAPVAAPTAPTPTADSGSLLGLVEADSDMTSFLAAINSSQRRPIVGASTPQTVFGPSNAAFDALGADYINLLLTSPSYFLHVRSLVDNHITLDESFATLSGGEAFMMLSQEATTVIAPTAGDVLVRPFSVAFGYQDPVDSPETGVAATNGFLYPIDSLLLPVWYYLDLISLLELQPENFSTLLTLIDAANLTEAIATSESTTLLAPNNAAFAALPAETTAYLTDPANVEVLQTVLLYHFLPELVNPLMYPLGQEVDVATSEGSDVTILVQRSSDNTAATSFNGVASAGNVFLTKNSIRFELPEVLFPAGLDIPGESTQTTAAPVAATQTEVPTASSMTVLPTVQSIDTMRPVNNATV